MTDDAPLPTWLDARADVDTVTAALRNMTAPALLLERAKVTPNDIGYAEKRLGIYQEVTWAELADRARNIGLGLVELGLEAGDRIALIGDAFPEWMAIDLGAQGVGAITYGIYPTSSPSELKYLLREGGAKIVVAEHQEYVDKVLPLLEDLPSLEFIVAVDTTALFLYEHPQLLDLADVEAKASDWSNQEAFDQRVEQLDPEAPATIVWTSGTTARPKGAVLTHGAHLASAFAIVGHYHRLREHPQKVVAFLPLCHVFGRDIAITLPLVTPMTPYYGESIEDLPTTLYEVGPTVLFTVPRYMQKFASQALVSIKQTSRTKSIVYKLAMWIGRRAVEQRWQGGLRGVTRVLYPVARQFVFRPLLDQLGLSKVRLTVSAGAPLPRETAALWQAWGLNLCDLYGQTEAGGGQIAAQPEPYPEPGNVGVPPQGWEVRLADDGEVHVRSADLFRGYWNDPEATGETLVDGWLLTGDVGRWTEDGRLELVDRKKDIMTTAGGKTLSPVAIESAQKASPYISEAIAFGHSRKYVTALIEIDYSAVAEWAEAAGIHYGAIGSLPELAEVRELIEGEVAQANERLARVEQVKEFRLLSHELDPEHEDDPVTPTRKVKRSQMEERFSHLINEMYDTTEEERIRTQLTGGAK